MDDQLREIEARLRDLDTSLADVVRRLDHLETSGAAAEPRARAAGAVPTVAIVEASVGSFDVLSLIGRTLIVLGGAFLLRALTDSGQLRPALGISLGMVYAVVWYGAADRAAGSGRPASSLFHGIAAVVISLPLVWEAATRFAWLGPVASAAAVGLLTSIALVVAARHRLQSLAGVGTVGAVVIALGLAVAMDHMASFAVLAIALGLAAWMLGESRLEWNWLRWPTAAGAALLAVGLTARTLADPPREALAAAVLAHALFAAAYLAAVAWRTLGRARPVRPFEIAMTAIAVGIGLGSALAETAAAGATAAFLVVGLAIVLASALAYGLAAAIVRRRQGRGLNYVFYTSLALVLLIIGCGALFDGATLAMIVAALGVLATALGSRATLPTFTLHGSILASTAAVVAGLLPAASVWLGTGGIWPGLSGPAWIALAAITACLPIPRPTTWDPPAVLATAGRFLLAGVFVVVAGTTVLVVVGPALAGTPSDAGALASVKTVVLAAAAVLLALTSRWPRLSEFDRFVYPVLVIGGLKLVLEDFRVSDPSTLFVALAAYGAALVLGPRLKPGRR